MTRLAPIDLTLAFALTSLFACASETDATRAPAGDAQPASSATQDARDPASVMEDLERRLLSADTLRLEFVIESTGAIASRFEGTLEWRGDESLALVATGEFAGQPQELELRADATTLSTFVGGQPRWSGPRPPALVEAIVVGFSHMGLLHNLAVLTGGMGPDHAEGGVREWLDADELVALPPERRGALELHGIEFVIVVAGNASATTSVWLDAAGLPVERSSVVQFPEGEMRVSERYSNVVITPA